MAEIPLDAVKTSHGPSGGPIGEAETMPGTSLRPPMSTFRIIVLFVGAFLLWWVGLFCAIAGIVSYDGNKLTDPILWWVGAAVSFASALACVIWPVSTQRQSLKVKRDEEIQQAEQSLKGADEGKPLAAWELARVNLEKYLDRNLDQVFQIFWVVVGAMIIGFIFQIAGIVSLYKSSGTDKYLILYKSMVVTGSGLLVQFISATFILVYRSTMSQAKDYVDVLERMNAVGMSLQVVESIGGEDTKLKNEAKSELAKKILNACGGQTVRGKAAPDSLVRLKPGRT